MPRDLEGRLRRLPASWSVAPLHALPDVHVIGYGITRPGPHIENGVGMVQAADIRDGLLRSDEPRRISRRVHETNQRSWLQAGDVVVVLVGRVGEAAVVTGEFHDWNAARTVAIIRIAESDQAAWLRSWRRVWLGSPEVREWCEQQASGSTLHRTLQLAVLRDLPVPLPPPTAPRADFARAMRLVRVKTTTNTRIADCAAELADAQCAVQARHSGEWPEVPIGVLTELHAGAAARPRPDDNPTPPGQGLPFVAPADILHSPVPHLYGTDRRLTMGKEGRECDLGLRRTGSR